MISADAIRGYIDIMILSLLRHGSSYAYEMGKAISAQTDGAYAIKQTTLYSALKRLEVAGHIYSFAGQSESGKPRTYYRLTQQGIKSLDDKCAEWEQTKTIVDRFVEGRS